MRMQFRYLSWNNLWVQECKCNFAVSAGTACRYEMAMVFVLRSVFRGSQQSRSTHCLMQQPLCCAGGGSLVLKNEQEILNQCGSRMPVRQQVGSAQAWAAECKRLNTKMWLAFATVLDHKSMLAGTAWQSTRLHCWQLSVAAPDIVATPQYMLSQQPAGFSTPSQLDATSLAFINTHRWSACGK